MDWGRGSRPDDRSGGRLPGPVPVERCCSGSSTRIRPHGARGIWCGCRTLQGPKARPVPDRQRNRSGTTFNALRVTRTGKLSHWKSLAYPNMAACCTRTTLLAKLGITGPLEVIEGDKGLMDAITGCFEVSWAGEDLGCVRQTTVKKYNAEIHSQTAIEAVLTLLRRYQFSSNAIERVDVEIFDVAYNIIGGGEEGDKRVVTTKEQADHSLPYVLAVAILDGQVMPEQYAPERIQRADVQTLLRKVSVQPRKLFSERFPDAMPCRVKITLKDGRVLEQETNDYEGFF